MAGSAAGGIVNKNQGLFGNPQPNVIKAIPDGQKPAEQPQVAQNPTPQAPPQESLARNTADSNIMTQAAQGMDIASQAAAAGTQYNPMQVQAQTVANTDMSQYMNPYENQVVGQTMSDLERARQMQQNQADYAMGRAGAFGGSRHGIAQAEDNRNFFDRAGSIAGQLRQQGYQQAQNMAAQDANRMLQADTANMTTDLAGAQQRLSAANQLAQTSNLGFDMGRTLQSDMMKQGSAQQLMEQQLIDAAKQQFAGYTGAPMDSISILSQALGASTIPQSQQTRKDHGLFDYLTLMAL